MFAGKDDVMFGARYGLLAAAVAFMALCQPAFAEPPSGPGAMSPELLRSMSQKERSDAREERRQALRERWQNMSPEEREAMKQRFRDQRQQVSPKEREARRQELRQRWQNMNPDERQRLRRDFEGANRNGGLGQQSDGHRLRR